MTRHASTYAVAAEAKARGGHLLNTFFRDTKTSVPVSAGPEYVGTCFFNVLVLR